MIGNEISISVNNCKERVSFNFIFLNYINRDFLSFILMELFRGSKDRFLEKRICFGDIL